MRLHLAAAALGLFALTNAGVVAQTTESPVAPAAAPSTSSPDADLKAKIHATAQARDELIQRFQAESAKKVSKDAKRDAELHALSGTICFGCAGTVPSVAPAKRTSPKRSVPKRKLTAPEEQPIVDDLH